MQGLIYQDAARYDWWMKLILAAVLLATFVPGLFLLATQPVDAFIMFGATLFDGLLFKSVMPQRYELFQEGIRIVLGGPFAINLPFSKIKYVRMMNTREAVFRLGFSFTTSFRGVVEIAPKKGMSYFVTPYHGEQFVELANQELERARGQDKFALGAKAVIK